MDITSRRMLKIFVIYWLISIVLTFFQIYGIPEVSSYTYILVILGVFSFCIGYLLIARKRNNTLHISKDDISKQVEGVVDNVPYLVVLIIASIYIYILLVVFFGRIMYYGSLSNVRTDYYSGELYGPMFPQINAFILRPLYLFTLPVFAYLILYKRNWVCFLSGFYLFGYESLGGGRIGYIRIVLAVVFLAYCLLGTFEKHKRKGRFVAIFGGVLIFALLSVVSAARKGETGKDVDTGMFGVQTASKHIVLYTAGPIAAFDYSIEHDYKSYIGGYQYGNLTLTPVTSFLNLFTSKLGFSFHKSLNDLLEYKQGTYVTLSDELQWNALYTANLYFYNDLDIFGVILFPLLFGIIISSLITKLYKFKSLPLVMLISFCFWCMMDSVLDYAFTSAYDFLVLLIMYIMGTRKKYLQHELNSI